MLNKVPQVTLASWAIKIMSTTVGETGADYLAVHVGLGAAVTGAITASLLAASLFLQLRSRRYVPWIYWLTVALMSVVGTQVTDALTDGLGVSLYARLPAWGFGHKTVRHGRGAYARDEGGDGFCEVHVNTMEGFWSVLRFWLRPHRGISQDKLLNLGFFQFVHNARRRGVVSQFEIA